MGREEGQDQPWDRMGVQEVDEEGDSRNSTREWKVKLGRVESAGRVLSSWSPLWATALRPPGNSKSQNGACLRASHGILQARTLEWVAISFSNA